MRTAIPEPLALDLRRRALGLTIADIARRAGVSYNRVWRFFTNVDPRLTDEERESLLTAIGLQQRDLGSE